MDVSFLLIMSTVGRTEELCRFFRTLERQTAVPFKIYLCDQNSDGRLGPVIEEWQARLPIRLVHSARGLSRGRNAALAAALRDVGPDGGHYLVAFPDDDCWYPDELLAGAAARLEADESLAGVTARSMTAPGIASVRSSPRHALRLDRGNLFRGSMAISYCLFLRLAAVRSAGFFDETLGVGAGTPWGAGEESDFLLRILARGGKLRYDPALQVFHPDKSGEATGPRFLAYARGHGRVLRLNGYSPLVPARDVLVALAAFVVKSLVARRILSHYLYRALGYLQGYLGRPPAAAP